MVENKYQGKVVAVTGAAGGIGEAIARTFIAQGARVAISDIDIERANATALNIDALAYYCDVGDENSMRGFIHGVETALGPIDIFVSNAGVGFSDSPQNFAGGGSNESWETSWKINTMANVYAARYLVKGWKARGEGRMVIVASAAGLLVQVGSGSYTTTKHAAVGFAEYMAIMHRADGIKVQCICPQYVKTNMTAGMVMKDERPGALLEPDDVASALMQAIDQDRFLVLPHKIVRAMFVGKAGDHSAYIQNMSDNMDKLQNPLAAQKTAQQNPKKASL